MKQFLYLLVIFIPFYSLGATGDTTHLRVHDEVHMNWNGNYDSLALFPDDGKTYRKILMKYTLGCPTNGCSEWDYTTKIRLQETTPTDTFWIELGRLITPYAGGYPDEWEQAHWFDVTDYAPVLKGEKLLRASYDGWQDGFTVTLDFYFIEGTPIREPKRVMSVYDGSFQYGRPNNPIENHLTPYSFELQGDETQVELHFTPTGHSFGGKENCAEFCPKNYYVLVNGSQIAEQLIWDNQCGNNPHYPQPGTWLYNRSNWCPGTRGIRYRHDLSNNLTIGQNEVNINMEPFTFDANHPPAPGTNPNPIYIMWGGLVTYGDWNAQNDAELLEIIAPNSTFEYNRLNPICSDPKIKIRNNGGANLTSVTIDYWVEGGDKKSFDWEGNLAPLEVAEVDLPQHPYLMEGITQNVFYAELKNPNNSADEYPLDNLLHSSFDRVPEISNVFMVWWRANQAPQQTTWRVEDWQGNAIINSPDISANETRRDTLELEPGCYKFVLEDSECNGLNFPFNNDGSGYVRLHELDLNLINTFDSNFGCRVQFAFTVGFPVGTENRTIDPPSFRVYPNPANHQLNLLWNSGTSQEGTVRVFRPNGSLLLEQSISNSTSTLNTDDWATGVYLISLFENGIIQGTHKVVISH